MIAQAEGMAAATDPKVLTSTYVRSDVPEDIATWESLFAILKGTPTMTKKQFVVKMLELFNEPPDTQMDDFQSRHKIHGDFKEMLNSVWCEVGVQTQTRVLRMQRELAAEMKKETQEMKRKLDPAEPKAGIPRTPVNPLIPPKGKPQSKSVPKPSSNPLPKPAPKFKFDTKGRPILSAEPGYTNGAAEHYKAKAEPKSKRSLLQNLHLMHLQAVED